MGQSYYSMLFGILSANTVSGAEEQSKLAIMLHSNTVLRYRVNTLYYDNYCLHSRNERLYHDNTCLWSRNEQLCNENTLLKQEVEQLQEDAKIRELQYKLLLERNTALKRLLSNPKPEDDDDDDDYEDEEEPEEENKPTPTDEQTVLEIQQAVHDIVTAVIEQAEIKQVVNTIVTAAIEQAEIEQVVNDIVTAVVDEHALTDAVDRPLSFEIDLEENIPVEVPLDDEQLYLLAVKEDEEAKQNAYRAKLKRRHIEEKAAPHETIDAMWKDFRQAIKAKLNVAAAKAKKILPLCPAESFEAAYLKKTVVSRLPFFKLHAQDGKFSIGIPYRFSHMHHDMPYVTPLAMLLFVSDDGLLDLVHQYAPIIHQSSEISKEAKKILLHQGLKFQDLFNSGWEARPEIFDLLELTKTTSKDGYFLNTMLIRVDSDPSVPRQKITACMFIAWVEYGYMAYVLKRLYDALEA